MLPPVIVNVVSLDSQAYTPPPYPVAVFPVITPSLNVAFDTSPIKIPAPWLDLLFFTVPPDISTTLPLASQIPPPLPVAVFPSMLPPVIVSVGFTIPTPDTFAL